MKTVVAWCNECGKETNRTSKMGACKSCIARNAAVSLMAQLTAEQKQARSRKAVVTWFARQTLEQRREQAQKNGRSRIAKYGSPWAKKGAAHHHWQGDKIGYRAAHKRIEKIRGFAAEHACVDCGAQARDWSFDGRRGYSSDVARYLPRCKPCHVKYDREVA